MARGGELQDLRQEKKRKKFVRLVVLLTIRKHGVGFILSLFFGFLLATAISAVDDIWTEFQRFQSCQEDFLGGVSQTVSTRYNEATRSVAASTVGKAACIAAQTDLCKGATEAAKGVADLGKDIGTSLTSVFGGRRLTGGCSGSPLLGVFLKWTVPGKITFPQVNMTINSNTDKVLASVKHDLRFLEDMAQWTRYAGWILAGISVLLIIFTAARYTFKNKAWKPSKISYTMHFITFLKVVAFYGFSVLLVILQAYSTRKFCDVAIDSIVMDAPNCIIDDDCEFSCGMEELTFANTCRKCDIKMHWWWVEPLSVANILVAVYFVFTILVLIFERREARIERQELTSLVREGNNKETPSSMSKLWRRMSSNDKNNRALQQAGGVESLYGNDLDGPLHSGEESVLPPKQPTTKYAASICTYPDKRYSGGLR